jgi:deoxycytidylate deaminase
MNTTLAHNCVRLAKNLADDVFGSYAWKHISFACRRTTVHSVGFNKPFKSHPIAYQFGYKFNSIHSELDCIIKLDVRPTQLCQYTLVNIRLDKQGRVRLSKPCKVCQRLLAAFRFKEVFYSDNQGEFNVLI